MVRSISRACPRITLSLGSEMKRPVLDSGGRKDLLPQELVHREVEDHPVSIANLPEVYR